MTTANHGDIVVGVDHSAISVASRWLDASAGAGVVVPIASAQNPVARASTRTHRPCNLGMDLPCPSTQRLTRQTAITDSG